jgi:SAM-dependent methyltransferase
MANILKCYFLLDCGNIETLKKTWQILPLTIKVLSPVERHNNDVIKTYDSILKDIQDEEALIFMNHGFAPCEILLDDTDQKWKHQISLYNNMLIQAFKLGLSEDLTDKSILEIGSGRGGGLAFVKKYYNPKQATGVDLNKNQVTFCANTHKKEGLNYIEGDACALDIEDNTIDIIFNVESSHCYSNINQFYRQVSDKLKPGGFFLYTDIFFPDEKLYDDFLAFEQNLIPGMDILYAKDMTENVIDACRLDKVDFKTTLPKTIAALMSEIAEVKLDKYEKGLIKYITVVAIKR